MHVATPLNFLHLPLQTASRPLVTHARPYAPDEELAGRSDARLLITAATRGDVESLARRIHQAHRGSAAFVEVRASAFPGLEDTLRAMCVSLLDRAKGGSLLIAGVEHLPAGVHDSVLDVIDEIQASRAPADAVRLISGTTVSLLDRVKAGIFSASLFYRLNLLHVRVPSSSRSVAV